MKNAFIKFGALVLALVMIVATAGCGDSNSGGKKPPSKAPAVINDNVNASIVCIIRSSPKIS